MAEEVKVDETESDKAESGKKETKLSELADRIEQASEDSQAIIKAIRTGINLISKELFLLIAGIAIVGSVAIQKINEVMTKVNLLGPKLETIEKKEDEQTVRINASDKFPPQTSNLPDD